MVNKFHVQLTNMKKALLIFLLLPLFAFPQADKRYRKIIIEEIKALTAGLITVKDITKFDLQLSAGGAADADALLTLISTTKGFLAPRMTTAQKNAIVGPTSGLLVYDTTLELYFFFAGPAGWLEVGAATAIVTDRIPKGTNTDIDNGTWEFATNTLRPVTDGSDIGTTGTNRVGTMFMDGTGQFDFATTLIFDEAGSERMRILTGGNVGIGVVAPAFLLDVNGTTNSTNSQTGTTGNVANFTTVKIFNDSTMTADGSVVGLLPAGYIIDNIIFKNTTGSSITQFDIGFTAGGGEIVGNGTISGNAEGSFTILQRVEDFDAADEIFFDANSFNGSTLILYIKMSRIF